MSIRYIGHVCAGDCHADLKHGSIIKAHCYDDAMEKFANTVNKEDKIHVFIYDTEAGQVLFNGFFGKARH